MKKLIAMLLLCALLVSAFTVTASAASVTDGENLYLAGDVNGDKVLNICDLVKANIGGGITAAADLDGNGTVEQVGDAIFGEWNK